MGGQKRTKNIPLVEIDVSLFADEIGVATADALDLGHGVHDLLLAVHIGVEETQLHPPLAASIRTLPSPEWLHTMN